MFGNGPAAKPSKNMFGDEPVHTVGMFGGGAERVAPAGGVGMFGGARQAPLHISSVFVPPELATLTVEAPPKTRISLENNLADLLKKDVQNMNMHQRIEHESNIHALRARIQNMKEDFRIKDILEAISSDPSIGMTTIKKNLGNATSEEIGTLHTMLRCNKDGPKRVLDILGKDYSYDHRA